MAEIPMTPIVSLLVGLALLALIAGTIATVVKIKASRLESDLRKLREPTKPVDL